MTIPSWLQFRICKRLKSWYSPLSLGVVTIILLVHSVCGYPQILNSHVLPQINDHIFPAVPAARSDIGFDARGFLIHGQRTFIVSAGIEYARVPRQLWSDRLLRLKRGGFNTVEIYTFWNFHEPHEGQFIFSGDRDLGAFLDLVHRMGMYAIVRVGPYYCAEWDSGGYPIWLRFKPGLSVREDNGPFLRAVDAYFAKLLPIVARRQIHHGGAVIMVQLENEHPLAWGTGMPTPYFTHLLAEARQYGLQVPMFFSGLHHSSDPAGDKLDLDDPTRPNPWFSTEFWSVWYNQYGSKPDDAPTYDRRTWKIIAHGGNGYNIYMGHGGSNFDYFNNNEDAASYDYGAAVGQAGDLRPVYYRFKRAAWFARAFELILENSIDARPEDITVTASSDVRVTGRKSSAGSLIFLDNTASTTTHAHLHLEDSSLPDTDVMLSRGQIRPIVHNFQITPELEIHWSLAKIFGIAHQGSTTTLVLYGTPGEQAPLSLRAEAPLRVEKGGKAVSVRGGLVTISPQFSNEHPSTYLLRFGSRIVRILALGNSLVDQAWFAEAGGQQYVLCGTHFAGKLALVSGGLILSIEQPWMTKIPPRSVLAYGRQVKPITLASPRSLSLRPQSTTRATIGPWLTKDGTQEAQPAFGDSRWVSTKDAMQMGFDGDFSADAWYRTRVDIPTTGNYRFHAASGGDRLQIFVDGVRMATEDIRVQDIPLTLSAGQHTLAIFAAHDGRDKLFGYIGAIRNKDPKGIVGPAVLREGDSVDVGEWRLMPATRVPTSTVPRSDAPGWRSYRIGDDAFDRRPGFAWFRTTLPTGGADAKREVLHFASVDEDATLFVNGKKMGEHKGWNEPFEVAIPDSFLQGGSKSITLSVLIENHEGAGGIDGPVSLESIRTELPLLNWRMHGGPPDISAKAEWQLATNDSGVAGPRLFKTAFTLPAESPTSHPTWRVGVHGLGHGSIWVNGHNLGRYPEKIPIDGIYIPGPWLHHGSNILIIYDEDGHFPSDVNIHLEKTASRESWRLEARGTN